MSLISQLFLGFWAHTNYAKMASAADFRSPRSSDQRRSGRLLITIHALVTKRFWQASRATNAARFVAVTSDHWHDRQSDFSLSLLFFFHSGKTLNWTRTHRHTAQQLWRRTPPSTSGICPEDSSSVRSSLSSAPRYFLKAYLKLLAFRQCHLTTQSPELRTLLPIQLSAAFTSRRWQANQSSTVSLSWPS